MMKNDEMKLMKLFYVKIPFRFWDIYIFVLIF